MKNRITEFLSDWPTEPQPDTQPALHEGIAARVDVTARYRAAGVDDATELPIHLRLERWVGEGADGWTAVQIDAGDAIHNEHGDNAPVFFFLRSPDALRALIDALTTLANNPKAASLIAAIEWA